MTSSALAAVRRAFATKPVNRFPGRDDPRATSDLLFPHVTPSFRLEKGSSVFTIGSCFARNVEKVLADDFDLPTRTFAVPPKEYDGQPNGLLNEYNPGTMAQRINWALDSTDTSALDATYLGSEFSVNDLLIRLGEPVSLSRAKERRREIDAVYAKLATSSFAIITLGLVECWYDNEASLYLNRMPDIPHMRRNPDRYAFRRLGPAECFDLLCPALDRLIKAGCDHVLLTVSPVPLQTTFSGDDCVVANTYSKAVLRIVADEIRAQFQGGVDYFPSYEIAMSGGLTVFGSDNVHIRDEAVAKIIGHMLKAYVQSSDNV